MVAGAKHPADPQQFACQLPVLVGDGDDHLPARPQIQFFRHLRADQRAPAVRFGKEAACDNGAQEKIVLRAFQGRIDAHEHSARALGSGGKHGLAHDPGIGAGDLGQPGRRIPERFRIPQPAGQAGPVVEPFLGHAHMAESHDRARIDHAGIGIISGAGEGDRQKDAEGHGQRGDQGPSAVP